MENHPLKTLKANVSFCFFSRLLANFPAERPDSEFEEKNYHQIVANLPQNETEKLRFLKHVRKLFSQ